MSRPTRTAVPTTAVKFRAGPGTDHPTVAGLPELQPGYILSVAGVQDGWAQLQDAYCGLSGYADAAYLDIQPVTTLFLPDLYWRDAGGRPAFDRLVLDARFAGAILKATQGTSTPAEESEWFAAHWASLQAIGGEDYGQSWFRGCYHFLDLVIPGDTTPADYGAAQARHFLDVLGQAGGLGAGDLPPAVDVEVAGDGGHTPSNEALEQLVSAWAEAVSGALGRRPMIYRRSTDSDFPGLVSSMGCGSVWAKRYDRQLGTLTNGWSSAALWQYTDGSSNVPGLLPPGYPYDAPGIGRIDISAVQYGDGSLAALRQLIAGSVIES